MICWVLTGKKMVNLNRVVHINRFVIHETIAIGSVRLDIPAKGQSIAIVLVLAIQATSESRSTQFRWTTDLDRSVSTKSPPAIEL